MKHFRLCAALLLLLLCMTLPAYAAEVIEPPPHKEPPPLMEDTAEETLPAPEPPHKDPPPAPPPTEAPPPQPEGEFNPIVDLCLDANGGTFRNSKGMNLYDASMPATPGTTLASTGYTIDKITCAGKTFQGWIAYNAVDNTAISGLLTTAEVLNYTIPNHHIRFEIQWNALDDAPITSITYAALYNGTGKPASSVRVTLIANGNRYSGNGYVTISKDVYSKWKGNVKVIWECPGEYVDGDGRWNPDYFESEGSVSGFIKGGSSYISVSKTGKEQETPSPRDVVNDFFYSVRNVKPEVSPVEKDPAPVTPSVTPSVPPSATPPATPSVTATLLPEGHTLSAQRHQSGSAYDDAVTTLQTTAGSSNVLLFDITAKDASGADVHQLGQTVKVTIRLPAEYVIQAGNTALVYYLPGDGTAVPCETTYHDEDPANRYLVFKTDHFSMYAVAEVAKPPAPPMQPETPTEPANPTEPATPPQSETPAQPTTPTQPVTPPAPKPEAPAAPEAPAKPADPVQPATPAQTEEPASFPVAAILLAAAAAITVAAVIFLKKRR